MGTIFAVLGSWYASRMSGLPVERHRPRPVADASVPALADGTAVAKRWLMELMSAAPLSAAGDLPTAQMARRGPVVCSALIASLGSDGALERLINHGSTAADASGARAPAALVAAIEALRTAAWSALRDELRPPDPELLSALSDRLAHACSALLEAALDVPLSAPFSRPPEEDDDDEPQMHATDLREVESIAPASARRRRPPAPAWSGEPSISSGPEGEPWRPSIEKRLKRHDSDKLAFAVLAVELDDLDRLLATGDAATEAIELAERGISATLRPGDVLIREHPGRYWLTAPETDALSARALGEQLAQAVADGADHHGVPLTVSIGIAVCPQDGTEAEGLAAHADEAVFAARAAGVRLA
jgi:GGDEF domain-containing protein